MAAIEDLLKNIETIEALLGTMKEELKKIQTQAASSSSKPKKKIELPSDEEMRKLYNDLYEKTIQGDENAIRQFVLSKSKEYLKVFCRANNLPLDGKRASKETIIREMYNWMAVRRAITQKAI